jgi:exonuclease VII large subunit
MIIKSKNAYLKKELGYLINRKIFKKPTQILNTFMQALDLIQISLYKNYSDAIKLKTNQFNHLQNRLDKRKIFSLINTDRIILSNWQYKISKNMDDIVSRKEHEFKVFNGKDRFCLTDQDYAKRLCSSDRNRGRQNYQNIDDVKIKKNIKSYFKRWNVICKSL